MEEETSPLNLAILHYCFAEDGIKETFSSGTRTKNTSRPSMRTCSEKLVSSGGVATCTPVRTCVLGKEYEFITSRVCD